MITKNPRLAAYEEAGKELIKRGGRFIGHRCWLVKTPAPARGLFLRLRRLDAAKSSTPLLHTPVRPVDDASIYVDG